MTDPLTEAQGILQSLEDDWDYLEEHERFGAVHETLNQLEKIGEATDREHCPECGSETEFVQFGGAESGTTVIDPEEVGAGLLELRSCPECPAGVKNILTVEQQNVEKTVHER